MQYIKDPQKKSEDFLGHFMRNDDGTYMICPLRHQPWPLFRSIAFYRESQDL